MKSSTQFSESSSPLTISQESTMAPSFPGPGKGSSTATSARKNKKQPKLWTSSNPVPSSLASEAVLRVNDGKLLGSLSAYPKLPYAITVHIDGSRLQIEFSRASRRGNCYRRQTMGSKWQLAYVAGDEVAATITNKMTLGHFHYEVVERSGNLGNDTRTALQTADSGCHTHPLVQITIRGTNEILGNTQGSVWDGLDTDVVDNVQAILKGDHDLTIWFLIPPWARKDMGLLSAFEASVGEEVQRLRLASHGPHVTVEQIREEHRQLKDQTSEIDQSIHGVLSSRLQQQEAEIKQLRDVGQFWLGLERLRHDKIAQFFAGPLPEDDIMLELAKKGPL